MGRCSARNASLKLLVRLAYGFADCQVSGGPDWVRFEKFDVEAKPEANPSVEQLKTMLQRLQEDRFQLKVRRATKQDLVYALLPTNRGPRLEPAPPDDSGRRRNDPWRGVKAGQGRLFTQQGEIAGLAAYLAQILDRPFVDRTNLDGAFAFDFALPSTTLPSPDSSESIFESIQDQLGLRLEQTKGRVEFLVIESVERLAEN